MAIVELMQLMQLTEGKRLRQLAMTVAVLLWMISAPSDSPPPPPTTKQADTEPEVARRKLPPEGGQQLKRGTRHKLEVVVSHIVNYIHGLLLLSFLFNCSTPLTLQAPQRHLSNRERKEQAKAARKKRRVEEQRQEGARQGQRPKTDPVGAVAI